MYVPTLAVPISLVQICGWEKSEKSYFLGKMQTLLDVIHKHHESLMEAPIICSFVLITRA